MFYVAYKNYKKSIAIIKIIGCILDMGHAEVFHTQTHVLPTRPDYMIIDTYIYAQNGYIIYGPYSIIDSLD